MRTRVGFKPNGKNIRIKIAMLGETQTSFAKAIGITGTYLSRIVNDKCVVSPKLAKEIAENLNSEINDIFYIEPFANNETSGATSLA